MGFVNKGNGYFGIPYRTMTEWELGHRKLPGYVLRMMKNELVLFESKDGNVRLGYYSLLL